VSLPRRLAVATAAVLTAVTLAACGGGEELSGPVSVPIRALQFDGQSGTGTLSPMGNNTEVSLDLSIGQVAEQPAHIHEGTCSQPGAIVHGLNNVQTGRSVTTVPASLSSLKKAAYIIVVHKSVPEMALYAACGSIPAE
jgi:hypothetical protein